MEELFPESTSSDVHQYVADRIAVAGVLSKEAELKWKKSCPFKKQLEKSIEKNGRGMKPCLKWSIHSRRCFVRIHYFTFTIDVDAITLPYTTLPDWVLQLRKQQGNTGGDSEDEGDQDEDDEDEEEEERSATSLADEDDVVNNSNPQLVVSSSMW